MSPAQGSAGDLLAQPQIALGFVEDRATRAPLRLGSRGLARLDQDLRGRGVLCFVDNPLTLAPPLVITASETDHLVEAVTEAVHAIAARR